jgi:hypothetical protein
VNRRDQAIGDHQPGQQARRCPGRPRSHSRLPSEYPAVSQERALRQRLLSRSYHASATASAKWPRTVLPPIAWPTSCARNRRAALRFRTADRQDKPAEVDCPSQPLDGTGRKWSPPTRVAAAQPPSRQRRTVQSGRHQSPRRDGGDLGLTTLCLMV